MQLIKSYFRRRSNAIRHRAICAAFNEERVLSRFIAKDVRREIRIVNIDDIESGFIIAQIRTNNLLYMRNKLTLKQSFGEPQRISLDALWDWTGQSWGGLADGTTIADHVESTAISTENAG